MLPGLLCPPPWLALVSGVALLAPMPPAGAAPRIDVASARSRRVLGAATAALREAPRTITAARSPRSAGGVHDFFSEGDYWWPDPANPGGPYIQRDGMTNPDNFVEHRRALMRLSVQVPRSRRLEADEGRSVRTPRRRAICAPGSSTTPRG